MKIRITAANIPDIAFEVLYVDCVETDNGRVEPNIRFSKAITKEVRPRRRLQMSFNPVEGGEERGDCFSVGFICPELKIKIRYGSICKRYNLRCKATLTA